MIKLAAVFRKFPDGYAAFVKELPGANRKAPRWKKRVRILKNRLQLCYQRTENLQKSRCAAQKLYASRVTRR
jgi:hypothetical protein